jgi:hypothetical protein
MNDPGHIPPPVKLWHVIALAVMLGPIVLKTMVGYDALPWWGTDPTVAYAPMVTLTPARSVLLDIVSMAGALVLLASGVGLSGWRSVAMVAMALIGAGRAAIDGSAHAFSWCSAFVACATLATVGRQDLLRRASAALLVGCIVAWVGKGAAQLLIEHPITVANFRENKEMILRSQGWTVGSSNALAFERRLMQAEATGWFAMSNVFASVCAGCLAFCAAGLARVLGGRGEARSEERSASNSLILVLAAGATMSLSGVLMSGSKGGLAAAGLAIVLAAIVAVLGRVKSFEPSTRIKRIAGSLAVASVLGVLALVAVRGAIGERVGELSILFRWFYLVGAARTFEAHPLMGVGVEHFREAYMLFKPPISPEEVTSPHSVFFDMAACLGLAGFAVVGMLLWSAARAGVGLVAGEPSESKVMEEREPIERSAWMIVFVTAAVVVFASVVIESELYAIDVALVRLASAVGWLVLARVLITGAGSRMIRPACAAAGIVLLAHAQIEVSAISILSCGWVFAMIGLAAAGTTDTPKQLGRGAAVAARVIIGLALAVVIAAAGRASSTLLAQEAALHKAAGVFAPLTLKLQEIRDAIAAGERNPELLKSARTLERQIQDGVGPASQMLDGAGRSFEVVRLRADLRLRAFVTAGPRDGVVPPEIAAGMIETCVRADGEAERLDTAAAWGWAGGLWVAIAERLPTERATPAVRQGRLGLVPATRAEAAARGLAALELATQLDPHGLTWALAAFRAADASGDSQAVAKWAAEALRRNEITRLDPLRGLSAEQKSKIERVVRRGTGGS